MRISGRGQITIPKKLREQCGLKENDEVEVTLQGKRIVKNRRSSLAGNGLNIAALEAPRTRVIADFLIGAQRLRSPTDFSLATAVFTRPISPS